MAAFARDPKASAQVWSRHGGYPGDGAYLDFHKIRWPGGLKYWRVTGSSVDMGAKEPYDPPTAAAHADAHAAHFARLIDALAADEPRKSPAVLAAPFDTELFGHWWFEGPHFLEETYRLLPGHPDVHPSTASAHLQKHPPAGALASAGRLLGRQRQLQHVAQRADGLDLGTPLAAGRVLLGCGTLGAD